jgi:hypothetical protein
VLPVAEASQGESSRTPSPAELRQTTYIEEMSMGLPQSEIEKWTVEVTRMKMTFYDKAGARC